MKLREALPDTECDCCWRAEAPRLLRVQESFARLFRHENQFASVGLVMLAALGGKTGTWYDRHRTDYVQTGDPRHLARMLRHVEKP